MPARRQHVRRCGDLERSCTDVLLYFAAVLAAQRLQPESEYVSDQAFYCRPEGIQIDPGPTGTRHESAASQDRSASRWSPGTSDHKATGR
jgi:hypothetical protein